MADRVSSLPDAVLCHILSFLPTKLAVATSVLSKRWKPLWLSVTTLDFNDEYVGENAHSYFRFVRFVYKVMLSRDLNQPITRFRLTCESCLCDPHDVNTWVNAAIQRKVQHLNLSLPKQSINLPSSILTSETLVVLKLESLIVDAVPSVCFHSLKILHLKSVIFLEHRYLKVLLSKCPILEDLRLCDLQLFDDEVNWGGIGTEQGFKTLHKLVRASISNLSSIPLKSICNVQFLRIEVDPFVFISIPVFHNLTHLEVTFVSCYSWDVLEELLKHCPKLQILVIDKLRYPNSSYDNDWVDTQFVPECVSSHLKTCSLRDYEGQQGELQFVRYIMKNARFLQTMSIYCTAKSKLRAKFQMLKELSLCPRSSVSCELSFE